MNKLDGLMLLGWYLTRPAMRPTKILPRPKLLPETIVSWSNCFCGIRPNLADEVYGLAVHIRHLAALCIEVGLCSDDKRPTDVWATPAQGDEILLGYDIMGYNRSWNGFHRNYLQDELFDIFGANLNNHGLIADAELAETFTTHIHAHYLGEPGLHLP